MQTCAIQSTCVKLLPVSRPRGQPSRHLKVPNNFHYGQRIKRRATYLLRTFIHIKSLKFSFGLSAQPRAIEFLWQKVWVNLAEEFFGEISKPLTSKDLAFVTIRYDDIYDRHDTKLRSLDLEKSGKKQVNTRVKEISHI